MVKRITVFVFFSSLLAVSMYGCGKNEPGNPQLSGQSSEQDFAKIHKNVDFNKEDKEKCMGWEWKPKAVDMVWEFMARKKNQTPARLLQRLITKKSSVRI